MAASGESWRKISRESSWLRGRGTRLTEKRGPPCEHLLAGFGCCPQCGRSELAKLGPGAWPTWGKVHQLLLPAADSELLWESVSSSVVGFLKQCSVGTETGGMYAACTPRVHTLLPPSASSPPPHTLPACPLSPSFHFSLLSPLSSGPFSRVLASPNRGL